MDSKTVWIALKEESMELHPIVLDTPEQADIFEMTGYVVIKADKPTANRLISQAVASIRHRHELECIMSSEEEVIRVAG